MTRQISGRMAEAKARFYLEKQGLQWIMSNYRCLNGEIDLIMQDDVKFLIFVEVRYRHHLQYGESIETVSQQKQQRIIRAAWHYLQQNDLVDKLNCRFDVVGLATNEQICWIQNAFEVRY